MLAREREVEKAWKLSAADWVERRSWDKYITAYEDAIQRCNAKNAPWIIVPANRKWFRNVVVAEAIVDLLRPYREVWLEALADRGRPSWSNPGGSRRTGIGIGLVKTQETPPGLDPGGVLRMFHGVVLFPLRHRDQRKDFSAKRLVKFE